jgi:hypothetical protein
MKTTVEISDGILRAAKAIAVREETSVRALIEEGLRRLIAERRTRGEFRLRDVSFAGGGLQPGMREGDWSQVSELAYQGRGS